VGFQGFLNLGKIFCRQRTPQADQTALIYSPDLISLYPRIGIKPGNTLENQNFEGIALTDRLTGIGRTVTA
jgi:hypothetical protein